MIMDSVVSYHMRVHSCGVAKFNQELARRLGVPCRPFEALWACQHPLISVKWSELEYPARVLLLTLPVHRFSLLWHDRGDPRVSARATRVWQASEVGCPSTIHGNASRGTLNLLSVGMAHKFQEALFEQLQTLLARTSYADAYTISVTAGVHEGFLWDLVVDDHLTRLRTIFGDHLRYLGNLADDALAKEFRECQGTVLFYDPAVRANNTTLWAALEAGSPVVTNLDAESPPELQHGVISLNSTS